MEKSEAGVAGREVKVRGTGLHPLTNEYYNLTAHCKNKTRSVMNITN